MHYARFPVVPAVVGLLLLAGAGSHADQPGQFLIEDKFTLRAGETHTGDMYVFAGNTRISGTLDGDLFVMSEGVWIDGDITGDLVVMGERLEVTGRVGDSVRFFGSVASIIGTIDGDLIICGKEVRIAPQGRVTGNLVTWTARATVDGTVDGQLVATAGEVVIDGTVRGDARLEADAIRLGETARLGGDLSYTSRRQLEMGDGAIVAGETTFEEKIPESDDDSPFMSKFGMFLLVWRTIAAMIVGLIAVALSRRFLPAVLAAIREETVTGGMIGFGAFLVVPAAALLAIILVVTLPLGALLLMLFLVALYLAKMPVAVWLGGRLLRAAGRTEPSPYASIVLGLPVIYVATAIPFFIGGLVWLVVTWLGLGAMILALRSTLHERAA